MLLCVPDIIEFLRGHVGLSSCFVSSKQPAQLHICELALPTQRGFLSGTIFDSLHSWALVSIYKEIMVLPLRLYCLSMFALLFPHVFRPRNRRVNERCITALERLNQSSIWRALGIYGPLSLIYEVFGVLLFALTMMLRAGELCSAILISVGWHEAASDTEAQSTEKAHIFCIAAVLLVSRFIRLAFAASLSSVLFVNVPADGGAWRLRNFLGASKQELSERLHEFRWPSSTLPAHEEENKVPDAPLVQRLPLNTQGGEADQTLDATQAAGQSRTSPQQQRCPICFADFNGGDLVVQLPCHESHLFHKECAETWLLQRRRCPLCAADVLDFSPHARGDAGPRR